MAPPILTLKKSYVVQGNSLRSIVTPARRDGLILAAIIALATVLRFLNLQGRGEWDDDQGNLLLAMLHWVRDGDVPLLGPVSSFGGAHHGVGIYWLLAPGAFLTDTNPAAALVTVAVLGIAGVAATWWLGRTVGGALAGHVAGLLMAVSPSSITASTLLWNPDIVAPGAALAAAAGWHAWRTRQARWWVPSAVGALLALHGHMLAVIIVVPLVVLLAADVLRRPRSDRRGMIVPLLGSAAVVVVGCAPLVLHELRYDFSETRAIVEYATGANAYGRTPPPLPIVALVIIAWRVVVWPVSGLFAKRAAMGGPGCGCHGRGADRRRLPNTGCGATIWPLGGPLDPLGRDCAEPDFTESGSHTPRAPQ